MLYSTLLTLGPNTFSWISKIALIMIICNIVAIAFAKLTVKYPSVDPAMPGSNFFGGFRVASVLANSSFGHILGASVILG
ncbi:MAG: photosystem I reaction center subunit PsaK [Okeania sp. SIO3I5]|uniref:photosystem I reaction center subunit PsaK n=1 Tax=Okeania sp. SIO3I5 TaxID=2607805 RepID=UPI0013B6E4A8|nr:photosystem I reaction center subunit PsaK [Okeania sp. SIO3I5]NEQ38384.1 photosystem I reaction center subunit PsaK [Okeania sp. SIO3I5]